MPDNRCVRFVANREMGRLILDHLPRNYRGSGPFIQTSNNLLGWKIHSQDLPACFHCPEGGYLHLVEVLLDGNGVVQILYRQGDQEQRHACVEGPWTYIRLQVPKDAMPTMGRVYRCTGLIRKTDSNGHMGDFADFTLIED